MNDRITAVDLAAELARLGFNQVNDKHHTYQAEDVEDVIELLPALTQSYPEASTATELAQLAGAAL